MERILLASNYPNLYKLGLHGLDMEKAISLVCHDTALPHVNKDKISSLVFNINKNKDEILALQVGSIIFARIFTMFINLKNLNFDPFSNSHQLISFDMSPPTVFSSNLLELHIHVGDIIDCLYLLDGRFNQLQTFHVTIMYICSKGLTINNEVDEF
ncbi:unnamed protein product [Rotaria sp. Silwood2]|nr:unnamed protein product [Rotaria sp. Silwood2]CAF4177420.1 unnamed protein product [Rotaria sp. Silwood2]